MDWLSNRKVKVLVFYNHLVNQKTEGRIVTNHCNDLDLKVYQNFQIRIRKDYVGNPVDFDLASLEAKSLLCY